MAWQNGSICQTQTVIFQRLSVSAAFPGLASFHTFFDGFLQFKGKTALANQAVSPDEKRHHVGGNFSPLHDGQSDQPGQSRLFVGEGSICPPHSHEQQEVSAVLFGCQVPGVAKVVSDVKLHERNAHDKTERLALNVWWR